MKKITLLVMVFGLLLATTNLNAQLAETYYSTRLNGGDTFGSSSAGNRFAGYGFGGVPNHTFNNATKNLTIEITDYDENNPVVGPELYIRWARVGFGNAPLNWGSDNVTEIMTLVPGDFTGGAATVNVTIPAGTTPVADTADYVSGYLWILQIVGVNGAPYVDSEHAYMNYVIDITDNILNTNNFSKNEIDANYVNSLQAIVLNDNALEGEDYAVYNVLGQVKLKGNVSREISVSDLNSGLYFLTIPSKGTLKFVVNNR